MLGSASRSNGALTSAFSSVSNIGGSQKNESSALVKKLGIETIKQPRTVDSGKKQLPTCQVKDAPGEYVFTLLTEAALCTQDCFLVRRTA